jgi:FkbM family methyltransferase
MPIDLAALLTTQPRRRYTEFSKILRGLSSSSVKARSFYELVLADLIATLVKPNDTVIDVGGNVGKHTLNFLRALRSQGKCITIEPNPKSAQIINDRLKRYRYGNLCELINVGVSDRRTGTLPFYTVPQRPAVSRFNPTADFLERYETKIIQVPVRRLDDIVSTDGTVSFLKVDVEGHEVEVLSGAERLIQSHRPYIFFECSLPRVRAAGKAPILMAGLEATSYRLFSAFGDWINADTVNGSHPTNFFAYPIEREPLALSRLHSAIMLATMDVLFSSSAEAD